MKPGRCFARGMFVSSLLYLSAARAEAACDARMMIVNDAASPVIGMMAKNSGATDWTPVGRPSAVTVAPGEKQAVDPSDGTDAVLYDVVFLLANGQILPQERIDVCKTTELHVRAGGANAMAPTAPPPPPPDPPARVARTPPPSRSRSQISTVKVPLSVLRTGPGLGYPPVPGGGLPFGTNVLILKIVAPWLQVLVPEGAGSGRIGFVNGYEFTPPR